MTIKNIALSSAYGIRSGMHEQYETEFVTATIRWERKAQAYVVLFMHAGSSGVYTFAFSLRDARALAKNVLNNMNAPCDGEILSKCLLSYNYNPQRLRRGASAIW